MQIIMLVFRFSIDFQFADYVNTVDITQGGFY